MSCYYGLTDLILGHPVTESAFAIELQPGDSVETSNKKDYRWNFAEGLDGIFAVQRQKTRTVRFATLKNHHSRISTVQFCSSLSCGKMKKFVASLLTKDE